MSSPSLYRVVAFIEIIASAVIILYGIDTFLIFRLMDEEFQTRMEMIRYSSIVAVVQSVVTMCSALLVASCNHSTLRGDTVWEKSSQKPEAQVVHISRRHTFRRVIVSPMWLCWNMISVVCLTFVVAAPMHYCIQNEKDKERLAEYLTKDGTYEAPDLPPHTRLGRCSSFAAYLQPIRNSLCNLYSACIMSVFFKIIFMVLVYRAWRREMRSGKKRVVYFKDPKEEEEDNERRPRGEGMETPDDDPRIIGSSTTTTFLPPGDQTVELPSSSTAVKPQFVVKVEQT